MNHNKEKSGGKPDDHKGTGAKDDQKGAGGKEDQKGAEGKDDQKGAGGKVDRNGAGGKDDHKGAGGKDDQKGAGGKDDQKGAGKDDEKGAGKDDEKGAGKDDEKDAGGKDDQEEAGGKDGGKKGAGKEDDQKQQGPAPPGTILIAFEGGKDPAKSASPGKDEPKGLQKIFNLYSKSGGLPGGGSGLSKENGKKWLEAAGLMDDKTGCSEKDFNSAFDKVAKGENSLDFFGFRELVEKIVQEKQNKSLKEFYDKLVSAGPPKD